MALRIIRNDIAKVSADAIVNPANPRERYNQGCDFTIYNKNGEEGAERLENERKKSVISPLGISG